jgi:hypothetical protein
VYDGKESGLQRRDLFLDADPRDEVNMESRESTGEPRSRASHAIFGSRRCAMRVVQSGKQLIAVYELDPMDTGAPKMLVFETSESSVCLEQYPMDWHSMPEESLLELRQTVR